LHESAFILDPSAWWCPECMAGRVHWRAEHEAYRARALAAARVDTAHEFQKAVMVALHAALIGILMAAWMSPAHLLYLILAPFLALIVWARRDYLCQVVDTAFPVTQRQIATVIFSFAGFGWLTALVWLMEGL
jgi:hypothetical protein